VNDEDYTKQNNNNNNNNNNTLEKVRLPVQTHVNQVYLSFLLQDLLDIDKLAVLLHPIEAYAMVRSYVSTSADHNFVTEFGAVTCSAILARAFVTLKF